MKRFDLMFGVNVRGTFACSQACLPHLKTAAAAGRNPAHPHVAPPLNLDPKWFGGHVAYTMAKYGMSMCVLGMAAEFRADGIGVNALWPRSVIATAAVAMIPGAYGSRPTGCAARRSSRTPPSRSSAVTRAPPRAASSSTRRCSRKRESRISNATRSSPAPAPAGPFLA
jgi:NAD(P)-dependent dehydrogenase (short-subunit alcohol dehydrogenase family)